MRSSSGGWVSNRWLSRDELALAPRRWSIGSSIQRCAVARLPECTDGLVVAELLQRRDQARRVAGHLHAGDVGQAPHACG